MKKLFYIFVFSFAAAPLLAAVSTCETRVDKHQDASTSERVNYCLTEEPEAQDDTPVTEVVLSDVYSVQYPKQKTKQKAQPAEQTKVYNPGPTSMEYLDRDDYPAFRNDVFPAMNEEDAHEAALEAISAGEVPAENKGKKSLKKPGRVMKALPAAEEQTATITDTASYASYSDPAYGQTGAYPTYDAAKDPAYGAMQDPAAYAAQQPAATTPAAYDMQQAQNPQNDPLYQNYAANGTGQTGLANGNATGTDNLGYNNTNPALQQ